MTVIEIETGKTYNVVLQSVNLNFDGKYYFRYNIGFENFQGFHSIECIYDNDTFNKRFKVIEN